MNITCVANNATWARRNAHVCGPAAAPYRPCLSRLAGQARRRRGSGRGCLTGAAPDIFARPYVQSPEVTFRDGRRGSCILFFAVPSRDETEMIDLYYRPTPHKITMFREEAGLDYTDRPLPSEGRPRPEDRDGVAVPARSPRKGRRSCWDRPTAVVRQPDRTGVRYSTSHLNIGAQIT